jgi:hypothetical protein
MDSELTRLRARVDALERSAAVRASVARVSAIVTMVAILAALPVAMRANGPSQVTAPFTVVDDSGRVLMKVESLPGRGAIVSIFNAGGRSILQAGSSPTGCCGWLGVFGEDGDKPKAQLAVQQKDDNGIVRLADGDDFSQVSGKGLSIRKGSNNVATVSGWSDGGYLRLRNGNNGITGEVMSTNEGGIIELGPSTSKATMRIEGLAAGKMAIAGNGAERATIGVSADDAGLIRLSSTKGSLTTVHGNGVIRTLNPAGKEVIDLGIDPSGNGILDVRNNAAEGGVRLEVLPDGSGTVKIHTPPFNIKAQMGIKEGGKGDVCVEGAKGLVCLSGIAIKNFIPW